MIWRLVDAGYGSLIEIETKWNINDTVTLFKTASQALKNSKAGKRIRVTVEGTGKSH